MDEVQKIEKQLAAQIAALQQQLADLRLEFERVTETLLNERNLLLKLIDYLPDHLYIKDSAGHFIVANKAVAEYLGAESPQAMIGKTCFEFLPPETAKRYHAQEQYVFSTGQAEVSEAPILEQTTPPQWHLITKIPLCDNDNQVTHLLGINRNVTDYKTLEERLKKAYNELEQRVEERTAELVKANADLQREIAERQRVQVDIIQRNLELFTLQAAGAAMASSLNLKQVLNTVTIEMTNLTGIECCVISDWNRAEDTVYTIAGHSPNPLLIKQRLDGIFHLPQYPLTKEVLYKQTPQQMTVSQPDIDPAELAFMQMLKVKTLVMLPMVFGGRSVGLVELLDSRFERKLTMQELDLAQLLANQAASAIENARLHNQAQQEIQERKRAEAAALLSRDTFQRLIQQLPVGVQIFDTNGLCIDINEALMRIFGIQRREDSVGRFNLFSDNMAQQVGTQAAGQEALAGKIVHLPEVVFDFEQSDPLYKPPYDYRTLAVTFFPVRATNDQIVEVVALNEDITERKQTDAVLTLERKNLAATLRSIGDGVIAIDNTGSILLANPVAEAYLKFIIDADIKGMLSYPGTASLATWLTSIPNNKTPYDLVVKDKQSRIFEVAAHPLTTVSKLGGQVIVLRDVTESRLAYERNQQQERLAAVGQLAAGIAHDFNNILTSVIGFAELLRIDPSLSPEGKIDVTRIVQQGQRGAHLIKQILDFSRQTVAAKHPVNMVEFVQENMELLRRTIPENINMNTTTITPGKYMVNADTAQLQQMLTNLALNSRDAMPNGGLLTFSLTSLTVSTQRLTQYPEIKPGQWVVLSVTDTGEGIDADIQDHIFEPFFTTKDVDKGTGLGLSQVDGIVKQHDGQIYVESKVGRGTTFTIFLPAIPHAAPSQPPVDQPGMPRGHGETILLVEDDKIVLRVTEKMLQHLGYRVLTAPDGEHALDLYQKSAAEIALILTDVNMPKMGGLALAQKLKQDNPNVKVIAMTGYPLKDGAKELLSQGIVNWLPKPVQVDELARIINSIINNE